ncbi:type I-E CRISPR-associated protein Cas5/CasD [Streptomyces sp. XY431]|uniref:type I-E CRISPR-associated protein Cas5/CasD n=1 Tax=Streptomyces sp. XY431 TaxID=1415562 RepID=UPI0006B05C71|nr:type I-E CRISPR-associated protein Cas5/CasD [Streptomyces sp. XY431]
MTDGVLLHLAGPLQSWGGPKGGRVKGTHPYPTRSGVTGMLAAALGRRRGADLSDLDELVHLVRVDRPGRRMRDYHTVGGGLPAERTVVTANGKRRGNALVFDSWYLADAAFTVAVTGPREIISEVTAALQCPTFPPYLGRRSCPPSTPVLVTAGGDVEEQLRRMPLHRPAPRPRWDRRSEQEQQEPVSVRYIAERPPGASPGVLASRWVADVVVAGTWTSRPVWESQESYPADGCHVGTEFLVELARWRRGLHA